MFKSSDVKDLLRNKHVVIIGDSVQRGVYMDVLLFLQEDRMLTDIEQKMKGDQSFLNDTLVYRTPLTNATEYSEIREYQSEDGCHLLQFYFVTRCYGPKVEAMLKTFEDEMPDIIIMNSCMWDISRYGDRSEDEYVENMGKLLTRLRQILPKETMFLWTTTMPLASKIVAGFLLDNISFLQETLRVSVMEANYYVSQMVTEYGFDVLDLHFYMRTMLKHRLKDGVHWDPFAHRHISELIIAFLFDSFCIPLPPYTVNKLRAVDLNFDFAHFLHEGRPHFVEERLKKLEEQAGKTGPSGPGSVSGVSATSSSGRSSRPGGDTRRPMDDLANKDSDQCSTSSRLDFIPLRD